MGRIIDTGLIFCNLTVYQRGGHIVRFWHQNLPLGCDDFKHHTHGYFDQTRDVQQHEIYQISK